MASVPVPDPLVDKVIAEVERMKFHYTVNYQYDIALLSTKERRLQVRDPNHVAPKEQVNRYAIQMPHTKFPPVVVTSDGFIVDGCTRTEARILRGDKFFPAVVLDIFFTKATDDQKNRMTVLASSLNQENGLPLTPSETRSAIAAYVALSIPNDQIHTRLGVSKPTISAVRKEISAQEKLAKVGMDIKSTANPEGSIKPPSLGAQRALGNSKVLALNDAPFKTLAALTIDAGFSAAEVADAAKMARESGSDIEQTERLNLLAIENKERIAARSEGKPTNHAPRKVLQYLEFLLKYRAHDEEPDRLNELIETTPLGIEKQRQVIKDAQMLLTDLLDRMPTPEAP